MKEYKEKDPLQCPNQRDIPCYIPKRYILTLMGFLGMLNVYALRINLSVALVAMVNTTILDVKGNISSFSPECPELVYATNRSAETNIHKGEQYNWDSKTQGYIMSAFFYCYFITMLTGGYFAYRFGPKLMFGGGVLVTGLLTLLTPIAVRWGFIPFIVLRALEGISEGLTYPAIIAMIGKWSPKLQRSRISSAIFTGAAIGSLLSLTVSGWLCSTDFLGGWPSVFYVSGAVACIWYVFWAILIYESPHEHPHISKEELSLYFEIDGSPICQTVHSVPWRKILTSFPMWAVIFTQIGSMLGLTLLLTEMPTYLTRVLHFNIESSGSIAGIPYLCEWIGAGMSSFAADKLVSSGTLSITAVRKIFNSLACYGSGLCLIGIVLSGCHHIQVIVLYSLCLWINGFKFSGFNATHVDMSPSLAGTTFAFANGIACIGGIVLPNMTGAFTASGDTISNWGNVFYITAAVYISTATFFNIFASAELQPWLKDNPNTKSSEQKYGKTQR